MTSKKPLDTRLSAEQTRFALEHDAYLGMVIPEADAIIMYRDDPGWTHRWIVDRDGQVIQDDAFRNRYGSRASARIAVSS